MPIDEIALTVPNGDSQSNWVDLYDLLDLQSDSRSIMFALRYAESLTATSDAVQLFWTNNSGTTQWRMRRGDEYLKVTIDQDPAPFNGTIVLLPPDWFVMMAKMGGEIRIGIVDSSDALVAQAADREFVLMSERI
jgi:hypothetical protein